MRVKVDADTCTGHGRCYVLCPEVFQEDDSGYCVIAQTDVPDTLEDKARHAAAACPERAIEVDG